MDDGWRLGFNSLQHRCSLGLVAEMGFETSLRIVSDCNREICAGGSNRMGRVTSGQMKGVQWLIPSLVTCRTYPSPQAHPDTVDDHTAHLPRTIPDARLLLNSQHPTPPQGILRFLPTELRLPSHSSCVFSSSRLPNQLIPEQQVHQSLLQFQFLPLLLSRAHCSYLVQSKMMWEEMSMSMSTSRSQMKRTRRMCCLDRLQRRL